ncbi:MAG: carbonate dehydratase [Flavobacteriales bacterium]|nr:carbonate dehydratase [Flavobacteriales bacterium]
MDSYHKLLLNNKAWAENTVSQDPDFFHRLEKIQRPEFLWIGCSDSRVPANEITGTNPGEIFVHRNIANMVVHTDLNLLSVLQYAVEYLKVKHVIVCGHYGCGGVQAAMTNQSLGLINKWLRNIKDVYRLHKDEVDAQPTEQDRLDRMVELNVQEQVFDLMKTSIIQKAWKDRGGPHLHGWAYRLSDGIVKPICDVPAGSPVDAIYRFDNLD